MLLVDDAELARRRAALAAAANGESERGYRKLFLEHVTQAEDGCDFAFLRATEMTASAPRRRS